MTANKLMNLHAQGLDGGQIAARLGVSRQRVWQMRKKMGLPTARPPTTRQKRLPIVAALVEQGLGAPEIADQLGVRRTLICNDVKALGLKTKTPTEQREGAIRQLLAQGKGQDAIGQALKLSPFTIRNDCRKLGLLALLDAINP